MSGLFITSKDSLYLINEIGIYNIILIGYLLYKNNIGKNKIKHYQLFNRILLSTIGLIVLENIKLGMTDVNTGTAEFIYFLYRGLFTYAGYCFFEFFAKLIHYKYFLTKWYRFVFCFPFISSTVVLLTIDNYGASVVFFILFAAVSILSIVDMLGYVKRVNTCYADRTRFILFPFIPLAFSIVHSGANAYQVPLYLGMVFSCIICYNASVELLISIDPLTNLNNRNGIVPFLNNKIKYNETEDLHLLLIDLDKFKSINDTFGHSAGDKCLVETSTAIKHACGKLSKRSYICRYGGDEFLIVTQCTAEELYALLQEINNNIESAITQNKCNNFSVSIGVADYKNNEHICDFINRADENLYKNKKKK